MSKQIEKADICLSDLSDEQLCAEVRSGSREA